MKLTGRTGFIAIGVLAVAAAGILGSRVFTAARAPAAAPCSNDPRLALGCYVPALTDAALKAAAKIGPVTVDMGGTACKVPEIAEYIEKVRKRGTIGKKRKTAKC